MKKIAITFLLFIGLIGYSQTNGITYQAVILNPLGDQLPGVNNTNAPLANKNISLKFSIIDQNSQYEYVETVQTNTDEFGMVNLIIGTGVQTGGYASSFSNILWHANPKRLKVDLSITELSPYYSEISNQPFTAVPFALFAVNSESTAALTALQATVAANATATNAALALKENAINKSTTTTLGTSNILFPTQNAVKTYVDTNISTSNTANTAAITTLGNTVTSNATATTAALALKEDAANKSTTTTLGTSNVLFPTQNAVKTYVDTNISTSNTANTTAITNLGNTVTSNATATTAALGLKEDAANKSTTTTLGTSNVLFPTQNAVKTYVDTNISTVNTSNTSLQATVAANAAATTTALGLKEDAINKSTTTTLGTSNVLFPTQNAVKTYVDTNITSVNANNTALQTTVTSNATATTAALALKEDAINKSTTTILGTSDLLFPTQNAVKTYVDTNISTSNTANTAAITTLGNTVTSNATATTAALGLKEDAANKSTTTTLGTSNVLFPTQNAVKTYVDNQVASATIADADATTKGKIKLAGDLAGTAAAPVVANNAIITAKIADASVTDPKIVGVSGSKVIGNISGSAANVTGIIPVANGGTGVTTVAGIKSVLGFNSPSVAIGDQAGQTNQGSSTVGVGGGAGATNQGGGSVAVGYVAGYLNQGNSSVAIGSNAAQSGQGNGAVAVGFAAGQNNQGANSVAIGTFAGQGQAANSIALNATGAPLNPQSTGFYVAPVRNASESNSLFYNTTTKEITYGAAASTVPINLATGVTSILPIVNGGTGATTAANALTNLGAAPISSPSFIGTPTAPTAAANTNNTQLATTAFVTSALTTAGLPSQSGNNGKFLTTNGSSASWATGVSGSGTLNYIPRFSSSSALSNSSLSDDGTGLRIGNPNGTGGIYTGLSSYDNTRLMVSGGREYESIRMTFPGDPYNNELSFNWYGSAWRMRTERSSGEITDLSFWKTTGAGVTTEKMRIDDSGYVKATGFKTQSGTSSQFLKANGTVDNSTYLTPSALTSPALTGTPTAPTATANTNTTQIATTAFVTSALTTAGLPSQSGNNGKFLTTNGSAASWAASPGVPYSGATGAVNLGNYNLTVYGVKVGVGSGPDPYFLQYSTVVGKDALVSNTYGWQNNAFGFEAMNQNTTGNGNNAFGLSAMRSNTSGNNNVAVGQAALHSSVTGNMNTAIGASAAYHSLGSQVTSIGYESLMGQGTGTGNTALGWRAGAAVYGSNTFSTFLGNNATAQNGTTNATAIGNDAFVNTSNTIQLGNTSITNVKTSGTLTAGNVTYPNYHNSVNGQILTTNGSGVASWTNTIAIANGGTGATTSAAALTNLGAAPLVSPTFTGTPTATTASTGTNNTQIATTAFVNSSISSANSSLAPIWSPSFNGTPTAPTAAANTNTTQIATTAFVASALTTAGLPSQSGNNGKFLTTNGSAASWAASPGVPYSGATGAVNLGDYNLTVRGIKIGTSGTDNTALQNNMVIGRDALVNTTNGYNNMAIGNTALGLNVGGYNNLAIGNESQYKNLWGWGNVSLGIATLNQNVVGNFNTAVGHGAGYFLTSSYNTAFGHNALDGQGGGGGNTAVGVNSGQLPWHQTTYNSTFLGYNAKAQSGLDNVIVIGYNAYTNEHNTIQLGNGSIVKLKTSGTIWSNGTQLTSDARLKTNIQPIPNSLDIIMKLNPVHYTKKNSIESTDYAKTENGFIAQELQKVLPYLVIEGTDKDKILSVDYNSIIPVLTKGIQEQQLLIKAQQKQIDEMRLMLDKLLKEKK